MKLLKFISMIMAVAVWLPLGLVLWIPLLVRSALCFTGSIPISMLSGNPHLSRRLIKLLEFATSFYINGFRLILVSLYSMEVHPNNPNPTSSAGFGIFVRELFWTLLFWGGIVLLYLYVF